MLSSKAMLMRLSISQWSARRYDAKASGEVALRHGAKNAGNFNKVLIDGEELKPIATAARALREYHDRVTLPWSNDGARLLPASTFMDYMAEMRKLKAVYVTAVNAFVETYPALRQSARTRLGSLYDAGDYPDDVRHKFDVTIEPMPVPDAADFRVDIGADEVARVRGEVEAAITARLTAAMNDALDRVIKVSTAMHEALSDPKAVFRDSLVENVADVLEVLPALNFMEHAGLTGVITEMRALVKYRPEELRKNHYKRADTAEAAWKVTKLAESAKTPK